MQALRTLIVDDETLARKLLRSYLEQYEELDIIGECKDGFEAALEIKSSQPDLVFLDVQMPKLTGFEMLEILDHFPQIVFVTAYDQYALKAFELNATDYLMKPVSRERLDSTMERIREKAHHDPGELRQLSDKYQEAKGDYLHRVVVKEGGKIKLLSVAGISHIEAKDDYVLLHTDEGQFLKQQTLTHFEKNLPPGNFVRIHRSTIIAVDKIASIENYGRDGLVVNMGKEKGLRVSKSRVKNLKEILNL